MNCRQKHINDISQLHRKAKCCLVLRRFGEAVQVCGEVLEQNLQKDSGEKHPINRIHDKWTPFVAIALQAYAELNQHKTAVGFASKVFGNPEKFPPVVLELCICLLLKASEYGAADELAEEWLCCEENFFQQNYLEITELYIKHVLLPQGLHEKIEQFLDTNKALTSEQKKAVLTTTRELSEELECRSSPVESGSCKAAVDNKPKAEKQGIHCRVVIRMLAVLNHLQRLCRDGSCRHWHKSITILRILTLLFFIYALVLAASGFQGVTPGSGLLIFWQAVLNAWRAMFRPYHLM